MSWRDYIPGFLRNLGRRSDKGGGSGTEKKATHEHIGQQFGESFTGEKSFGGLGPPVEYKTDIPSLRAHAWRYHLDNDLAKGIIRKLTEWVVGSGLRIEVTPRTEILKMEGVGLDEDKFREQVEARSRLFFSSKHSTWNEQETIHTQAKRAYEASRVGGDVLVVMRFNTGWPKVQLIDGRDVETPPGMFGDRRVENGVQIDKFGRHVGYWVRKGGTDLGHKFIRAKGPKTGLTVAWMIYGERYTLRDNRGIPVLTPILETLGKIDRYKEATVGSAEEREKVPYQIIHDLNATGEPPGMGKALQAVDKSGGGDIPHDDEGQQLVKKIEATMEKTALHNAPGTRVEAIDSKNEVNFGEFYQKLIEMGSATGGVPSEVVRSKFETSFSSSRAALKTFEHTMENEVEDFSFQFYQTIFENWLTWEIMNGKIDAPGYVQAFEQNDIPVLEAYRGTRYEGPKVPHIDPLKEVKAEREKLGSLGKNMPFTTQKRAAERLNGGNNSSLMEEYAKELEKANDLGIDKPSEGEQQGGEGGEGNEPPDNSGGSDDESGEDIPKLGTE